MNKNYSIITTKDGSLSLDYRASDDLVESMHHSAGALSESLFIYGKAISWSLNHCPISILSIGLGTAMNELIAISLAITSKKQNDIYIESYESSPYLIDNFNNWLFNHAHDFNQIYTTNLNLIAKHFSLNNQVIIDTVKKLINENKFIIRTALTNDQQFDRKFNTILYDMFSTKMNEHLWSDEFLSNFMSKVCDKTCCLATYASTSSLKRALKKNDFEIIKTKGFARKREATFAYKIISLEH